MCYVYYAMMDNQDNLILLNTPKGGPAPFLVARHRAPAGVFLFIGAYYVKAKETHLRPLCRPDKRSSVRSHLESIEQFSQVIMDHATKGIYWGIRYINQPLPLTGKGHDEPTNFLESSQRIKGGAVVGNNFSRRVPKTSQQISSYRSSWLVHTPGNKGALRGTMYKGINYFILSKYEKAGFNSCS